MSNTTSSSARAATGTVAVKADARVVVAGVGAVAAVGSVVGSPR